MKIEQMKKYSLQEQACAALIQIGVDSIKLGEIPPSTLARIRLIDKDDKQITAADAISQLIGALSLILADLEPSFLTKIMKGKL